MTSRSSGSPWAVASSDLASHNLEKALGPYPLSTHSTWHPCWDQDDALRERERLFTLQLSFSIVINGALLKILMASERVAPTFSRGSVTTVGLSNPDLPRYVLLWIMPHFLVQLVFWIALGVASPLSPITQEDAAAWPYSVNTPP